MAVQITMVPVWTDGDVTIPTKFCIEIDLSTVQKQLERYPVELGATVVVLNKEEGMGYGTY